MLSLPKEIWRTIYDFSPLRQQWLLSQTSRWLHTRFVSTPCREMSFSRHAELHLRKACEFCHKGRVVGIKKTDCVQAFAHRACLRKQFIHEYALEKQFGVVSIPCWVASEKRKCWAPGTGQWDATYYFLRRHPCIQRGFISVEEHFFSL